MIPLHMLRTKGSGLHQQQKILQQAELQVNLRFIAIPDVFLNLLKSLMCYSSVLAECHVLRVDIVEEIWKYNRRSKPVTYLPECRSEGKPPTGIVP